MHATAFLRVKGARDLTRRELAILRELVPWRDAVARRARPRDVPRGRQRRAARHRAHAAGDARGARRDQGNAARHARARAAESCSDAVQRGLAVPEHELPRFPKAARWDRDPDFDARVNALKTVRDEAGEAARSRSGRAVLARSDGGRRAPQSVKRSSSLSEVSELRKLADADCSAPTFVEGPLASSQAGREPRSDDSPYRDEN